MDHMLICYYCNTGFRVDLAQHSADPYVVCDLLKAYFHDMAEPLIVTDMMTSFNKEMIGKYSSNNGNRWL
jgi:hypothetical protein